MLSAKASSDRFVEQARARYYSPHEQGLISFACDVKVDFDTVPGPLLLPAEIAGRAPLEATKLHASLGSITGITVQHKYPKDVPVLMIPIYDKFFGWLSSIVQGFLQTWAPKAMDGPIPPKYEILGANSTSGGYQIMVRAPADQQVELLVNGDYSLTEIITKSPNEQIDEHPRFTASQSGLLLTHNDGLTSGDQTLHLQYDVDYQPTEGFELPHHVHMQVGENINMKFAFENCSTSPAMVVHVTSPKP